MAISTAQLLQELDRALDSRRTTVTALKDSAADIARACRDMAEGFRDGGRLLVFGLGASATDAEHIAVEFVHPVIVGKRALPALSLACEGATVTGIAAMSGEAEVFTQQIAALGRPVDIALGLSSHGADRAVLAGLRTAAAMGMTTIALVGGDGGEIRDDPLVGHCLVAGSTDAGIVKETHVTVYHVLWELVHVFLDAGYGEAVPSGGVEGLYPYLYQGSEVDPALLDGVAASTAEKIAEIVVLRDQVGRVHGGRLVDCATQLGAAFTAGATMWTFGNGGSSTDAADLATRFLAPTGGARPLPARCLTGGAAILTALANDVGYDVVFARQIRAFARPGDIAVGLSTSGGSTNVLDALDAAKTAGLITVGFSGYGGGPMAELSSLDFHFAVPSASVHRVQEVQTTLYHLLSLLTVLAMDG